MAALTRDGAMRLSVAAAAALAVAGFVALSAGDDTPAVATVAARPDRPTGAAPSLAIAASPVDAAPPSLTDESQPSSPDRAAMTACIAQARQWRIRARLSDLDAAAAASLEERSQARALASMAASTDPVARAAAEFFPAQRELLVVADGAACAAPDAACRERTESAAAAFAGHAERLVGHALASGNATVYGWAHRTCASPAGASVPACQLVSAGQWVRLAAGNAAPWLAVAREARRGNDPARLDEAMFQVASAARHDGAAFTLAALLAAHASPDDANPFGAVLLAARGQAFGAIADADDMQGAVAYCAAADLADANRREVCQRIATLLAERSTTLLARSTARGLGKRLGWSAEHLRALQEEGDAATATLEAPAAVSSAPACSAALRELGHLRAAARWGEVDAVRREASSASEAVRMALLR